jgi:hypothetical protein
VAELPRDAYAEPTWFEQTVKTRAPKLPVQAIPNASLKVAAAKGWGVIGCLIDADHDPTAVTYQELRYVLSGALMMRECLSELMLNANLTPQAREMIHRALRQTKYIPQAGDLVPDWIPNA